MRNLNFELKQLCRRNRDGSDATQRNRERVLDPHAELFNYIEVSYNRSRRHSTLGHSSPGRFLQGWISRRVDQLRKAA